MYLHMYLHMYLQVGHVDAIDIDIQGAEVTLVPELIELLDRKVARLIVDSLMCY